MEKEKFLKSIKNLLTYREDEVLFVSTYFKTDLENIFNYLKGNNNQVFKNAFESLHGLNDKRIWDLNDKWKRIFASFIYGAYKTVNRTSDISLDDFIRDVYDRLTVKDFDRQ